MPLLQIVIDLSGVAQPSFDSPFAAAGYLFVRGGWIPLIPIILWVLGEGWLIYIREKYERSVSYVILAIDVPRDNEQSPKAVEQLFAHLSGIARKGNLIMRYVRGFQQPVVSLELVSIGGYIQFLFRTPAGHRDLVESAIYAQYPNAEISEVNDYVPQIKPEFPNHLDLWGAEIALTNQTVFPIRTYPSFEHPLSQKFLDPIASLLEIMSRLKAGEQIWLQLLVTPTLTNNWRKQGERLIRRLIGAKVKEAAVGPGGTPGQIASGLYETLVASLYTPGQPETPAKRELPSLMQHLAPHERSIVESIGMKISKIGFETKFRFIYLADKNQFDITRVPAVLGALKQYNTLDLNGFKPDGKTKTNVDYFMLATRARWRKRRLFRNYRLRALRRGQVRFVLNVEELATVWHFPVMDVKAPLVKKTESKKAEPPATLPVATEVVEATGETTT